jgi:hypothetical protein
MATERILGFQQISVLTAAVAATVPAGTKKMLVSGEGQPVRWRGDGTDPTAAIGNIIAVNATETLSADLVKVKFIESAASAKVNITFIGG